MTTTTPNRRGSKLPGPQLMRHMYAGKDRSELVAKMTTRIPYELRAQLKVVATWPPFGYRTQTQMFTRCMVEFIQLRPWATKELQWRRSSKGDELTPLFHIHLEPTELSERDLVAMQKTADRLEVRLESIGELSGFDIKNLAMKSAQDAGVNQAAFALTFLWWIVLCRHPVSGTIEALMSVRGASV